MVQSGSWGKDIAEQVFALVRVFQGNAAFSLLLLLLVVIYFGSDRSILHFSRNGRRLYFLLLTSLLSWWLLSAVQQASSSGIEVLMVFVIIMASVVEDKLEQSMYLTPFCSRQVDFVTGTPEAIGKAELLESIVRSINRWQGFSIGLAKQIAWIDGSLHKQQAAIHQVIETADAAELNYLLAHSNCANLLEVASEETVNMLTSMYGSLKQLTVLSRAVLLDGLQKLGLRHRPLRQMWAQRILLATRGRDLTELKSLLDDAPDYHTFYKLLYSDVQGLIQQQLLEHVSREGQRALDSFNKSYRDLPGMILKVVSDIDDTLMSSGGHFPAGRDTRYPQKCVYPGVLSFYKGLDTRFALRMQDSQVDRVPNASEANPSTIPPPLSSSDAGSPSVSGQLFPVERGSPAKRLSTASQDFTPSKSASSLPVTIPNSPYDQPSPSRRYPVHGRSSVMSSARDLQLQRRSSEQSGASPPQGPYCGYIPLRQLGEQEMSGDLESVAESSILDSEVDMEDTAQSSDQGGLLGTTAGAAIGAVMPSANSVQSMVGFSMLAALPAYAGTSTGPSIPRPSTGCESEEPSSSGRSGPQQSSGHLVFLSARPQSYKGLTEGLSFRRIFEPLVRRGELQGYPLLLLGSMRVGPAALYSFAADRGAGLGSASLRFYKALAAKKLARFKQFAAIYPECCWIFVGDNGQGDMLLAEELNRICSAKMVACFMHQVGPLEETATKLRAAKDSKPSSWPHAWRQQRIYIAPDYISLAAQAREQGLIDDAWLQRVGRDACHDLRRAAARFPRAAFDRSAAIQQLNDGLKAANELLPEIMRLDLIPHQDT